MILIIVTGTIKQYKLRTAGRSQTEKKKTHRSIN